MTEKSAMRLAREAAGLSRKAVADAIGTTVHNYWHAEMPPFDAPPDVLLAAQAYLGLGDGTPTPDAVEGEAVERLWRCRSCHHEERQFGSEVWHQCRGVGPRIRLQLVLEQT